MNITLIRDELSGVRSWKAISASRVRQSGTNHLLFSFAVVAVSKRLTRIKGAVAGYLGLFLAP